MELLVQETWEVLPLGFANLHHHVQKIPPCYQEQSPFGHQPSHLNLEGHQQLCLRLEEVLPPVPLQLHFQHPHSEILQQLNPLKPVDPQLPARALGACAPAVARRSPQRVLLQLPFDGCCFLFDDPSWQVTAALGS